MIRTNEKMAEQNDKYDDIYKIVRKLPNDKNRGVKLHVDPITMVISVAYAEKKNDNEVVEEPDTTNEVSVTKKKEEKKKKVNGYEEYGMKKIFSKFKADSFSGSISTPELLEVFDEMGYKISAEEADRLKIYSDTDGDGRLDLEEFVNMILYVFVKIEDTEEDVMDAFTTFDYSGTDFITAEELSKTLPYLGDGFTEDEMKAFAMKGDLDRDGNINYGELTRKMFEKNEAYEKLNKQHSKKHFNLT